MSHFPITRDQEGFRVWRRKLQKRRARAEAKRKRIRQQRLQNRKRRTQPVLQQKAQSKQPGPLLRGGSIQYEIAARVDGLTHGGIGLMHELVRERGLIEAINENVTVLKQHQPYFESDHVLNIAYNGVWGYQTAAAA